MKPKRMRTGVILVTALAGLGLCGPGCQREEQGPILSGGREVKSWLDALHDPKPQVRRQAVLKLGNAGDTDPAALEGVAQALADSDPLVRHDAVMAVVKFRQPGDAVKAKVESMSKDDKDVRVRDVAKRASARLGVGRAG